MAGNAMGSVVYGLVMTPAIPYQFDGRMRPGSLFDYFKFLYNSANGYVICNTPYVYRSAQSMNAVGRIKLWMSYLNHSSFGSVPMVEASKLHATQCNLKRQVFCFYVLTVDSSGFSVHFLLCNQIILGGKDR